MLCDNCKKNPATRHTVVLVNGEKKELHLCAQCAKNRGMPIDKLPALLVLLSGPKGQNNVVASRFCSNCGSNLKVLNETGLLGCADCYAALREELLPVIKRAQGGRLQHIGRRPEGWKKSVSEEIPKPVQSEEESASQDTLEALRAELKAAVDREECELAAELRDKIRALIPQKEGEES